MACQAQTVFESPNHTQTAAHLPPVTAAWMATVPRIRSTTRTEKLLVVMMPGWVLVKERLQVHQVLYSQARLGSKDELWPYKAQVLHALPGSTGYPPLPGSKFGAFPEAFQRQVPAYVTSPLLFQKLPHFLTEKQGCRTQVSPNPIQHTSKEMKPEVICESHTRSLSNLAGH